MMMIILACIQSETCSLVLQKEEHTCIYVQCQAIHL